jgi:hypothetical protein
LQLSTVSRLKNEYFLQLIGYYLDDSHRILVYQFATHGSLHDTLHGSTLLSGFANAMACDLSSVWHAEKPDVKRM